MKKIITIFLSLSLFLTQAVVVFAANENSIAITSASDLAKIGTESTHPLDGDYYLANDITLGESWTPVAPTDAFTGDFDGNGKTINLNWNTDSQYIFKYVTDAEFYNFSVVIDGENARTSLAYMAEESSFDEIDISGEITKETGQIGGLLWVAYGCEFSNVYSEVDMYLTSPDFSVSGRYNIVGGIVSQITAEAGTYPWSSGEYANKFVNCSYSGEIGINLDNAVYGTSAVSTALWTGSIYGATAYDSPVSYYGVYLNNCDADALYDIGTNLNKTLVTQFNYIDNDDNVNATYIAGNKSASAKTEEEIVRYGRTHQNIHLTAIKNSHTKYSFGYYGSDKSQIDAGEHLWNIVSAPNLVAVATQRGKTTGVIKGLSSGEIYEYRLKGATEFLPVEEYSTEIKGLAKGTYEVRVRTPENVGQISNVEIYDTTLPVLNVILPSAQEIVDSTAGGTFTDEQLARIANGEVVSVIGEIKYIADTDDAYKTEISAIKKALINNESVVEYIDISLFAIIGGDNEHPIALKDFSDALTVKLEIPKNHREKGYDFVIINSHDSTAKRINATRNADESYITFEAENFSVFALVSSTSSIVIYVVLAVAFALIVLITIISCRKRRD